MHHFRLVGGEPLLQKMILASSNFATIFLGLASHFLTPLLKKLSHLSHNHLPTTLFKMTCAKLFLIHHEVLQGFPCVVTAQTVIITLESLC